MAMYHQKTKISIKERARLFGEVISSKKVPKKQKLKIKSQNDNNIRLKNVPNTQSEMSRRNSIYDIQLKKVPNKDKVAIDVYHSQNKSRDEICININDHEICTNHVKEKSQFMKDIEEQRRIKQQLIEMMQEEYEENGTVSSSECEYSYSSSEYSSYSSCDDDYQDGDDDDDDQDGGERICRVKSDEYYGDVDGDMDDNVVDSDDSDCDLNDDNISFVSCKRLQSKSDDMTDYEIKRMDDVQTALDNMFIDDDCKDDNDDHICISNSITINELLIKYDIYMYEYYHIYDYFTNTLHIRYCHELCDYLPISVHLPCVKPSVDDDITILIKLMKIAQYISNQVIDNQWTGDNADKWVKFNSNTFHYIHQPPPHPHPHPYPLINSDITDMDDINIIKLNGFSTKYIDIDMDISNKLLINIFIQQLPDKYKYSHSLIKIGIKYDDQILYITDRLNVFRNDYYIKSICINKLVDNNSKISFKINENDNVNIQFNHTPNYSSNPPISWSNAKHFILKKHKLHSNSQLFIQQFKGEGIYGIKQQKII